MIAMDIDVRDKNHSQALDDALHQLRNSSCSIAFHHGIENVDNTFVSTTTTTAAAAAAAMLNIMLQLHVKATIQVGLSLPKNIA